MRKVSLIIFAVLILAAPGYVFAAGSHDNGCTECHSLHDTKGDFSFGIAPNTIEKYKMSGKTVSGSDALCLGCHNDDEGIIPVLLMKSHPVGVSPVKAVVPENLLSDEGVLACASCHDPHPSNTNFKYLKADTEGGKKMGKLCVICHGAMVDKSEL